MGVVHPGVNFRQIADKFPKRGHIVIHSGFAEPNALISELVEQPSYFLGATLHTLMPMRPPAYTCAQALANLSVETFFPGSGLRRAVNAEQVRPQRCTLHEIPQLFKSRKIKADLILLQVSPPNADGNVSLGVSVDYMREVLDQSPIVVAQINSRMPFTYGDTLLPLRAINHILEFEEPLVTLAASTPDVIDDRIAHNVASLIENEDVIQTGIGALPEAVVAQLGHLQRLGVHTGILTQAWQPLIESGVVTNSTKALNRGLSITTMAGGEDSFYEFLDHNPAVEFRSCDSTHNPSVLAAIDRLCAINSVLQLDLQGNANAEKVNGRVISMPGGLPDFALGATRATRGKSIIALRSSYKNSLYSNIVPRLGADAPVTIDASVISHVVTEYGIADLQGLNKEDHAQALIEIAHPDHREALARARRDRLPT